MKMLRTAAGIALAACFVVLSGCATNGAPKLIVPPAQLLNDFCPVVNADLKVLSGSPLLLPAQQELVSKVLTVNTSVCAAGSQIDSADLQTLNATLFPALVELVGSLPLLPNQPAIMLGLTLAQPILAQVVQAVEAQKAAAPVAASQ
jgi:hypothetical protein